MARFELEITKRDDNFIAYDNLQKVFVPFLIKGQVAAEKFIADLNTLHDAGQITDLYRTEIMDEFMQTAVIPDGFAFETRFTQYPNSCMVMLVETASGRVYEVAWGDTPEHAQGQALFRHYQRNGVVNVR